jgi:hypothetical protein
MYFTPYETGNYILNGDYNVWIADMHDWCLLG